MSNTKLMLTLLALLSWGCNNPKEIPAGTFEGTCSFANNVDANLERACTLKLEPDGSVSLDAKADEPFAVGKGKMGTKDFIAIKPTVNISASPTCYDPVATSLRVIFQNEDEFAAEDDPPTHVTIEMTVDMRRTHDDKCSPGEDLKWIAVNAKLART